MRHIGKLAVLSCLTLGSVIASAPAQAAVQYNIAFIGTLPTNPANFADVHGEAINNSGEIVGHAFFGSQGGNQGDFLYNGMSLSNPDSFNSDAKGINDSGSIVGSSVFFVNGPTHAILRIAGGGGGGGGNLGLPGFTQSAGLAINKSNEVTGYSDSSTSGNPHAFLYNGSSTLDLGTLSGGTTSNGTALNAAGNVVGYSDVMVGGSLVTHAFLYNGVSMTDLGSLAGPTGSSYAYGINSSGAIAGDTNVPGGSLDAFIYQNGAMHDLGKANAEGINALDEIVGNGLANTGHPFVYVNGQMQDLTQSIAFNPNFQYQLQDATAINDNGQIIVTGTYHTNIDGAGFSLNDATFLLTPVPEPTALPILAAAAGLLLMRRQRGNLQTA